MSKTVIGPFGDALMARNKLSNSVSEWEDGRRVPGDPGYFEWWYFDARFDDGSTAVIVFQTKAFDQLAKGPTPRMQLAISPPLPDGRPRSDRIKRPGFTPAEFAASEARCDVRIGPNSVRGEKLHTYTLHAEADGLRADLEFTGIAPPWRPGSGIVYFDNKMETSFGWLPAIPFGAVKGTVTYDSKKRDVTGIAYHDHNWGNVQLDKVMREWYWGRGSTHDRRYSVVFADVEPLDSDEKMAVLMVARESAIVLGGDGTLTRTVSDFQDHSGHKYPRTLDIRWASTQGSAHAVITNAQIIDEFNPLTEFGLAWWKRLLAKLFGRNPYYFRLNADLELSVNLPSGSITEKGKMLYELMYFR